MRDGPTVAEDSTWFGGTQLELTEKSSLRTKSHIAKGACNLSTQEAGEFEVWLILSWLFT